MCPWSRSAPAANRLPYETVCRRRDPNWNRRIPESESLVAVTSSPAVQPTGSPVVAAGEPGGSGDAAGRVDFPNRPAAGGRKPAEGSGRPNRKRRPGRSGGEAGAARGPAARRERDGGRPVELHVAERAELAGLSARLPALMLRDGHRLARRLDAIRHDADAEARACAIHAVTDEVETAEIRVALRRDAVPTLKYPAELPVSQRKDEILAAIRDNQVVIVAGETGSGKTTQIPKICLELGRGVTGMIGHTQPRRLAARTVADRIAEETGAEGLGGIVGYQVRFTDQVGEDTLVKLMTDGILLAELGTDRLLRQYDTLIIDEAHERSLNIDFILGYLRRILPRRPDLKVVITSATIETERFSRHFGGAPIIEVSGRTYPVEVRYRPVVDPDDPEADPDRDVVTAICDAVDELSVGGPGDVLVFLSGEREIRDAADALARRPSKELLPREILPLYARLSAAEQHRVFQPHPGRRIVLATNVAETSLTVPGIKYVVDAGTARISRYSHRLKVQRLPIEPVSRASANQRAGRCGRTSDGICIRLYAEDDFEARLEYTDPEILRTNLASVILSMASLGLGEVADYPFLDPPDPRQVTDGLALLHELGAFEDVRPRRAPAEAAPVAAPVAAAGAVGLAAPAGPAAAGPAGAAEDRTPRLTPLGRRLARLPIDPRLARMILAAEEQGALAEVLVIAAALAVGDVRERPADAQQAATERHARFTEPTSDFLGYLNLWTYLRERAAELSSNQFRRMCRAEYLHYLRVREWQDVHSQLRQAARSLGLSTNATPASPQQVHTALLTGLLSHIGLFDPEKRDYAGARGARFAVFPGSALFKKPPRWVVAAELVETSRLWGRVAAKIEPEWVEPLAGHLIRRSHTEPHWSRRAAAVLATEKVTLYGVPIVAARSVTYGALDPPLCRELFIRHALVEGDWETKHAFFVENSRLLVDAADLEHRARRRDIVVDDQTVFDFYDARIPADVVSGRHFDAWWKKTRPQTPGLLTFDPAMLVSETAKGVRAEDFPDTWPAGRDGEHSVGLTYQFEPGSAADGVTAHIPLAILNQVEPDGFDWQVPGLREDLVTELIRSLPKALRRSYVPAPNYARAVLGRVGPADGPLLAVLERELNRIGGGTTVSRADLDLSRLPPHLRITFRVYDGTGGRTDRRDGHAGRDGDGADRREKPSESARRTLAEGKDLDELKRRLAPKLTAAVSAAGGNLERTGLTGWGDLGTIPRTVERRSGRHQVRGYPALVAEPAGVALRVLATEADQARAHPLGTRALLLASVASPIRYINTQLSNAAKLALRHHPHESVGALLDDAVAAAADALIDESGGPVWDEAGFERLRDEVRAELPERSLAVVRAAERVLTLAHDVETRIDALTGRPTAGRAPGRPAQLTDLRSLGSAFAAAQGAKTQGAKAGGAAKLSPALTASVEDLRRQLAELVHPGFLAGTGADRLDDLARYLSGALRRLDRLPADATAEQPKLAKITRVRDAYDELSADLLPPGVPPGPDLLRIRWMIEELRISLFAQTLRTPYPVSEERLYRVMDELAP
ncbi:ATP-dependent RNA helicase HrpA [Pseudofrankia sp. DC12]|uniref:ATP-dependent RNA helicase HrpA n=1 Tax=Pseudofrankia sp. DC12 TaxID=683315 RepID=UPI000A063328|nr:ATP-dependent RNA helicase HrpA [Pseudofrankia sp. DC12]